MSDERKSELKKAFECVGSTDELFKVFHEMESCFPESELGAECFLVANWLYKQSPHDLDQVLSFANRALTILTNTDSNATCDSSLVISSVFHLFGSVYRDLQIYDLSLFYLNKAYVILTQLSLDQNEEDTYAIIMGTLLNTHMALCDIWSALGRTQKVVVHATKILDIQLKMLDEGCVELAKAYHYVCEAYYAAHNYRVKLPFGLKALEIYTNCLGSGSVEVAKGTRLLTRIYRKMRESGKAFELLVNRARDLSHLDKFNKARKTLRKATKLLEKEGMDPTLVVTGYADMSEIYEAMKDFETAISLIKKALAVPQVPQKFIPVFFGRLFSLLSVSGKMEDGIPYMEGVVERLKESFGPEHYHVGECYIQLGLSYGNSGQLEIAAKYMANAKDILDASVGPRHLSSLKAGHALSVCYTDLGRYHKALEIEEDVIKGLKGLDASDLGFLHEVNKQLSEMKKRVAESSTMASPQSKDDDGLSTKISECSISDDGKLL